MLRPVHKFWRERGMERRKEGGRVVGRKGCRLGGRNRWIDGQNGWMEKVGKEEGIVGKR